MDHGLSGRSKPSWDAAAVTQAALAPRGSEQRPLLSWNAFHDAGFEKSMCAKPVSFLRKLRRGAPQEYRWEVWKVVFRYRRSEGSRLDNDDAPPGQHRLRQDPTDRGLQHTPSRCKRASSCPKARVVRYSAPRPTPLASQSPIGLLPPRWPSAAAPRGPLEVTQKVEPICRPSASGTAMANRCSPHAGRSSSEVRLPTYRSSESPLAAVYPPAGKRTDSNRVARGDSDSRLLLSETNDSRRFRRSPTVEGTVITSVPDQAGAASSQFLRCAEAVPLPSLVPLVSGADEYEALVNKPNEFSSLIDIDLPRTFPDVDGFLQVGGSKMRRLLNALANAQPEVGYCQGMNFVIGFLLIMSEFNELETFYAAKVLLNEYGVKHFFRENFPLLLTYVSVFDEAGQNMLPRLWDHFAAEGVFAPLYLHQWLLTLFVRGLPLRTVAVVWDYFLACGLPSLIPLTLSLVSVLEKFLIRLHFEELVRFLKSLRKSGSADETEIGQMLVRHAERMLLPPPLLRQLKMLQSSKIPVLPKEPIEPKEQPAGTNGGASEGKSRRGQVPGADSARVSPFFFTYSSGDSLRWRLSAAGAVAAPQQAEWRQIPPLGRNVTSSLSPFDVAQALSTRPPP